MQMADDPARKAYLQGTHRTVDPVDTVARVRALMPAMGITRIANVTGLDCIGIPVVMVCRPNARSLAVSQGKGVDLDAAKASGLMESVELYHGEHVMLPLLRASFAEMLSSRPTVDVYGLPRSPQSLFHPQRPLLWIEGYDLLQDTPKWVPFETVDTNFTVEIRKTASTFISSTNGLASGNHLLEAISHAICEVVERDAITLFGLAGRAFSGERRVNPDSVDDPICRMLLDRFHQADIAVGIWDATSNIGVPTFRCSISERSPNPFRPVPNGGGFGCHPTRQVALIRALTEAAQGRLTLIAGARDDMFRDVYELVYSRDAVRSTAKWVEAGGARRHFHDAPSFESGNIQEDVAWELERLRQVGISEVVVVDLTKPEFGLPVVKVVIPGLEFVDHSSHRSASYRYGARARQVIEERRRQEALISALVGTPDEAVPVPPGAGPRTADPAHHVPSLPARPGSTGSATYVPSLGEQLRGRENGVFVFTGPTLSPEEASRYLDAVYLPPVSQGDIYRVMRVRPRAIGIIDGYFERMPAVWHKEILWAMSQGAHVFGSASMGALRAVELASFGMVGVGAIFEAYRDGLLEDDDEVALFHGPAETGYRAISDAMVDIRATLRSAERAGVISAATRMRLEAIAKSLYYPNRTFATLLQHGREMSQVGPELDNLRAWLPRGRVCQKREDALAMLCLMRERLEAGLEPQEPPFVFEPTAVSERARAQAGQLVLTETGVAALSLSLLLEELHLDPVAYAGIYRSAIAQMLLRREAEGLGFSLSQVDSAHELELVRVAHALETPADLEQWRTAQDLTGEQFGDLLREAALARRAETTLRGDLLPEILGQLRLSGAYATLLARARAKATTLDAAGLSNAGLEDAGLTERQLLEWYFKERLAWLVPADLTGYARTLGFTDRRDLIGALLREYYYLRLMNKEERC